MHIDEEMHRLGSKPKFLNELSCNKYFINIHHYRDYIDCYFESFTIQSTIVIVSLLSCIVYVSSTYGYPYYNSSSGIALESIFFLIFLFDFIIHAIHARYSHYNYNYRY